MYHFGVVLLLLSFFRIETDIAAFVYLFVYTLSLNGGYLAVSYTHLLVAN